MSGTEARLAPTSTPPAPGAHRSRFDAADLLSVYVGTTLLVPGQYVVPGLGGVGAVSNLVGLLCGTWWVLEHLAGRKDAVRDRRISLVTVGITVYVLVTCVGFLVAWARPLEPVEEAGAIRTFVQVLSLAGVCLLADSGIRTPERLDALLRRLGWMGAVFAAIAIVQSFTSFDPVVAIRIPLLELNTDLSEVALRSGLRRVSSTALHAIEFGAVLAMLLPLALHRAWYVPAERRWANWVVVGVLAFALPLSVSRTAILALGVVLVFMMSAWSWRRRAAVLVTTVVGTFLMRLVQPGLVGTLVALFTGTDTDPSAQGRVDDYALIGELYRERPVLGRGLGTFDPLEYFFLDNQILGTIVTTGIVGLLALLVLVVASIIAGRQVYWHGSNEGSRHLGASLAASLAGGFAAMFTFDALSFPVYAGIFFLLCGVSGALWRIEVGPWGRRHTNPRARRPVAS